MEKENTFIISKPRKEPMKVSTKANGKITLNLVLAGKHTTVSANTTDIGRMARDTAKV